MLLHAEPGYTTAETRAGPYELLVSLSSDGSAFGWVYLDDGESLPPGPSTTLRILASSGVSAKADGDKNSVIVIPEGEFVIEQKLTIIVVLGVEERPVIVTVAGRRVERRQWSYEGTLKKLVVERIEADLNRPILLNWS
jgi:alpha-glucosidase